MDTPNTDTDKALAHMETAYAAAQKISACKSFVLAVEMDNGEWETTWSGRLMELSGASSYVTEELREAMR